MIAKESLRNLLALASTGADRHQVGHARWKFLTRCADSDIPEVVRLAVTVDRFLDTGHSNAKSEGINRVIKSSPATPSASATQRTYAYAHAPSPPAEPADTSAPLNLEDPPILARDLHLDQSHASPTPRAVPLIGLLVEGFVRRWSRRV